MAELEMAVIVACLLILGTETLKSSLSRSSMEGVVVSFKASPGNSSIFVMPVGKKARLNC